MTSRLLSYLLFPAISPLNYLALRSQCIGLAHLRLHISSPITSIASVMFPAGAYSQKNMSRSKFQRDISTALYIDGRGPQHEYTDSVDR